MNFAFEKSLYHSFLRILATVIAVVLIFDSGLLFPITAQLSTLTRQHVASVVGVSLGVTPNEVNQLTGRITELETELAAKERLIAINVGSAKNAENFNASNFFLSVTLFILLILIVLNYLLDYLRNKKITSYEKVTSNLA